MQPSPSVSFECMHQFFDDLPQNVLLLATAVAICEVVHAIFTLSIYLFLGNALLAATSYYAYKRLCEAARMEENLQRLETSNESLRRVNAELQELERDFDKGLVKLGTFQGKLEGLRGQIATERARLKKANQEYQSLNKKNAALHEKYRNLYRRFSDLTRRASRKRA